MPLQDFSTIASAIESILVGLAVICGGIWAIFRFGSLREAKKARAELDILKKSLEEEACIEAKIAASRIGSPSEFPAQLLVDISLTNSGNYPEIIEWGKAKIIIRKFTGIENKKIQYSDPLELEIDSMWEYTIIDPKGTEVLPHLALIEESGTYHISFEVTTSPKVKDTPTVKPFEQETKNQRLYWGASTIILVE